MNPQPSLFDQIERVARTDRQVDIVLAALRRGETIDAAWGWSHNMTAYRRRISEAKKLLPKNEIIIDSPVAPGARSRKYWLVRA